MKSFVISFITSLVISTILCVLIFTEIIDLRKILPEDMFAEKIVNNEVIVPNLLNLKIGEAEKVAEEIGIKIVIEEKFMDAVQAEVIIEQFPLPGFKSRKGDAVKLTISKAVEITMEVMSEEDLMAMEEMELTASITMPDITGLNSTTAIELLRKSGIKNISENYSDDDTLEKGKIISFNPPAGTELDETAIIDLVISKGISSKIVIVPNLYNKSLESAKSEISSNKLKLGKVNKVTDIDKGFDRIIGQSIQWGEKVKAGTEIDIDLNTEEEVGW